MTTLTMTTAQLPEGANKLADELGNLLQGART